VSSIDNVKNKKTGQLAGPTGIDKWTAWRKARNSAIESPRRLKTCKDKDAEKPSPPTSTGEPRV
jgi:hypothetical protein